MIDLEITFPNNSNEFSFQNSKPRLKLYRVNHLDLIQSKDLS